MVVALRDFANDESIFDRLYTLHAVPSAHGDDYSPWSRALAFYRRSVRSYRTSMLQTRHKTKSLFAKGGGQRQRVEPRSLAPAKPQRQKFGILSRRETEVAALIAQGLSNQQIAETLVIEPGTAANHVAHILSKLGLASRVQVAVWFLHSQESGAGRSGPSK